ncbi:NnrS family protein [Echinimonas agarilytica]|uniref:NnrS family protein n=1 Tax=Echinimonas agarilytica TaxID=1215918 RepID=A0AA41W3X5_9GAMM|nr:NnrS family protein [Echinimonas agarilytica]MCM2678360.1 NnrS family protein [Echinimonas agarilytica]
MQITDRAVEDKTMPLFRLGFRPLFLFGTVYAGWAMVRWILVLSGVLPWEYAVPVTAWHSHEMLFGFGMAIVVGFLTTAVQNWTGHRGINGTPLMGLFALWVVARITANFAPATLLQVLADAGFMLVAIGVMARQVLLVRNYKNLVFVPVLSIFLVLHLAQSWAMNHDVMLARALGFTTIWCFTLLISLLGARVIPFFIERRLSDTLQRDSVPWIVLAQFPLFLLALCALFSAPELWVQIVAAMAFLIHARRAFIWYRNGIWQEPLLWSLYLSYLCLPMALALLAVSGINQYSPVMHLLSVGLIGGMIMAMMCRVSLGHTGRPLKSHPLAWVSMASILLAAVSRVVIPWFFPIWTVGAYHLAATLWLLSIVTFLMVYTRYFLQPRVDGQIG